MEEEIMSIILNAGDARAKCLIALRMARKGDIDAASNQMELVSKSMILAHKVQTDLIHREVSGEKQEISLLLIHAQDHLMTAMAIRDIVVELIEYARDVK